MSVIPVQTYRLEKLDSSAASELCSSCIHSTVSAKKSVLSRGRQASPSRLSLSCVVGHPRTQHIQREQSRENLYFSIESQTYQPLCRYYTPPPLPFPATSSNIFRTPCKNDHHTTTGNQKQLTHKMNKKLDKERLII